MATEQDIQEGLQAVIQAIDAFAGASVVINDWRVLDLAIENAPYVIISNADTWETTQDAPSENTNWEEIVTLVERFTDWKETLDNFRTRRQALIDQYNAVGTARSAGGLEATNVASIRSGGPIEPYYDKGLSDAELLVADPVFLKQDMIFRVEQF